MFTDHKNMPGDSRIWIYQADRKITGTEKEIIARETETFLETWTAHEKALLASYDIRHDAFLIIMIDPKVENASGCSIDKQIHHVHRLEKMLGLSFMNRMIFAYRDGEEVKLVRRDEFEKLVSEGLISNDTIVFNNLHDRLDGLNSGWEVRFGESWHKELVS
jgi:hypothetical protein